MRQSAPSSKSRTGRARQPAWKQRSWRKFTPLLIVMLLVGGFGVAKLTGIFASSPYENGLIYAQVGTFIDPATKQLVYTKGYASDASYVTFSPDGSQVAYVHGIRSSDQSHVDQREIVLADADGSNAQTIYTTNENIYISDLSWSPNGMYVSFIDTGENKPRVINLATKVVSDIPNLATFLSGNLGFAPDSPADYAYISFDYDADVANLCRSSVDQPSEPTCTEIDATPLGLSSKDAWKNILSTKYDNVTRSGDQLYFIDDVGNRNDNDEYVHMYSRILSLNATNARLSEIIRSPEKTVFSSVVASPDGQYLAYGSYAADDGNRFTQSGSSTRLVDVDGKNDGKLIDTLASPTAWHPKPAGMPEADLPIENNPPYTSILAPLPKRPKQGSTIKPLLTIENKSRREQNYNITVSVMTYDNLHTYTVQKTVARGDRADVPLHDIRIPFAKFPREVISVSTSAAITGSNYHQSSRETTRLPYPKSSISSIRSGNKTVVYRRGMTVYFKPGASYTVHGKTNADQRLCLIDAKNSYRLAIVKPNNQGNFVLKPAAWVSEKRKLKVATCNFSTTAEADIFTIIPRR